MTALAVLAAGIGTAVIAVAPAAATIPGWGFEQVTPPDKGGAEPRVSQPASVSADGSILKYSTSYAMTGDSAAAAPYAPSYLARRDADGWSGFGLDVALDPEDFLGGAVWTTVAGVSEDGTQAVVVSRRVLAPGGIKNGANFYRHDLRTGAYVLIGANADPSAIGSIISLPATAMGTIIGASHDFDRIELQTSIPLTADSGPDEYGRSYIYEWRVSTGLRLQSRLEDDSPATSLSGPDTAGTGVRNPNYVSVDGSQIILSIPAMDPVTWGPSPEAGVFVRLDGDRTEPISYSRRTGADQTPVGVASGNAELAASPDGRFIAFVSGNGTRLSDDAPTSNGQGLYLYDRDQPEAEQLRFIVAGTPGITQLSDDGRTIYFTSPSQLRPGAAVGSPNVYVWRDGQIRLVAAGGGWGPGGAYALNMDTVGYLASPNGRYFAFSSIGSLTGYDNRNSTGCRRSVGTSDPDGFCREAFVYDAQLDELHCASCAPDGQRSLGHASLGTPAMQSMQFRARPIVTDDGTVFFDTSNGLASEDTNGDRDVYAYRDGLNRLVSRATAGTTSRFLTASDDGSTVFVLTDDRIVAQDTDNLADVYVTRAGAGIAAQNPAAPPPPCAGADCRAPSGGPPALSGVGTAAFSGPAPVASMRPSEKSVKVRVSKIKTVYGTSVRVKVKVPGKGKIRTSGSGLHQSHKTAKKAGSYRVSVRLSRRARRTLKRGHRVKVRVTVQFTPAKGKTQRVSVHATFRSQRHRKSSSRSARRASVLSSDLRKGR